MLIGDGKTTKIPEKKDNLVLINAQKTLIYFPLKRHLKIIMIGHHFTNQIRDLIPINFPPIIQANRHNNPWHSIF